MNDIWNWVWAMLPCNLVSWVFWWWRSLIPIWYHSWNFLSHQINDPFSNPSAQPQNWLCSCLSWANGKKALCLWYDCISIPHCILTMVSVVSTSMYVSLCSAWSSTYSYKISDSIDKSRLAKLKYHNTPNQNEIIQVLSPATHLIN